jgi:WD40 repeat protein
MKKLLLIFIMMIGGVAACQASALTSPSGLSENVTPSLTILSLAENILTFTTTQTTANTATSSPTPSPTIMPSSTPTRMNPTSSPEATKTPANLGPENFSQFVQIQAYSSAVGATLGGDIFDMRLNAVAYSPDGRYVALGGCTENWSGNCQSDAGLSDSFLFILDAQTAKIVTTLPETDTMITSLAFSSNSEKLIYATNPVRIVLWDILSRQIERVLWQDEDAPSYPKLAISPNDSLIVAVYLDKLMVWDAISGDLLTQKPAFRYGSLLPEFSPDGSRLAVFTQDYGKEITIYDTATWEVVSTIQPPGSQTNIVAFSPDSTLFLTVPNTDNVDILFWDIESGAEAGSLGVTFDFVYALAFSPDGGLLLVSSLPPEGSLYEGISVWDFSTRHQLGSLFSLTIPGRIIFSNSGSSFLMVDETFPLPYLWSLPDTNALIVRQATVDFIDTLHNGDYETAASLYQPSGEDITYFNSLDLDTSDLSALLGSLCAQPVQPCMPLKDILYEGKDDTGRYVLLLTFTAPDGSAFADGYGESEFWAYINLDENRRVKVNTLPSFFYEP